MQRILWWLRRDLRLSDNLTLDHAARDAAVVVPVFVFDPVLIRSKKLAPARRQFLLDSLADLDVQLQARGGRLILRAGEPAHELAALAREVQADAVYFHADVTPYARQRDARVMQTLGANGIVARTFHDSYLAAPEEVLKKDGRPYTVFSPYRRAFERTVSIPPARAKPARIQTPAAIPSFDLGKWTTARNERYAQGGAGEAERLLRSFVRRRNGLDKYGEHRNDPALNATSHLSPHLHFGTISVRELVRTARAMEARSGQVNIAMWIGELIWREFYAQVLWHFPHAATGAFRREYADLDWENNDRKFAAWCEGRTGYPIVDAGMRQLNETGSMHNRARMIVASFLTKHLLIDWRWGERYFMQRLADGDVASNNGGWQWAAGTGTDAQPYFRIFNPIEQGKRHDPLGAYVRRWIPELAEVPVQHIHSPWPARAGLAAGADYPPPIVDHASCRAQALAFYRRDR
jgi:deoxyribodipyrimidine photo-lyase